MLLFLWTLDTLEDFFNSPYPVGSYYKYNVGDPNAITEALGSIYEGYASDVEGAYAKMENVAICGG